MNAKQTPSPLFQMCQISSAEVEVNAGGKFPTGHWKCALTRFGASLFVYPSVSVSFCLFAAGSSACWEPAGLARSVETVVPERR